MRTSVRVVERDRDAVDDDRLADLVAGGATLVEIAIDRGWPVSRVRRRLGQLGLETRQARRRRENAEARAAGLESIPGECRVHGHQMFRRDAQGTMRCRAYIGERVARHRRKVKDLLVVEAGSRCVLCGYDRCFRALAFHHVDPTTKSFGIGARGHSRSFARARAEASKCVLLCSNCHAEVEAGIASIHPVALVNGTAGHDPG